MRRLQSSSGGRALLGAVAPAALLCLLAQLEIWASAPRPPGPVWVHAVLAAVTTLVLVGRRRLPLVTASVCVLTNAAEVVLTGGGSPLASFLAVGLAVFALARHGTAHAALGGGLLALVASTVRDVAHPQLNELDIALGWLVLAVLWLTGRALHRRQGSERALQQEAERLRREADEQARAAVAAERARLARELHDVVAHSISIVAVQAGAARWVLDPPTGPVHDALVTIERTSREALDDLRRMLEVLRSEDEQVLHAPQRGLADVAALVQQVRATGQPLELSLDATAGALPPAVELNVYRIVQEAVTNVLKHAPGAPAAVAVRRLPGAVEVEVTNGLSTARSRGTRPAPSGHGLVGMRERVALYGGELAVDGADAGGFRVRALLPVQPTA